MDDDKKPRVEIHAGAVYRKMGTDEETDAVCLSVRRRRHTKTGEVIYEEGWFRTLTYGVFPLTPERAAAEGWVRIDGNAPHRAQGRQEEDHAA